MAYSLVQTAKGNGGGYVNSAQVTWPGNTTTGNLIVIFIAHGDGTTVQSVTDSQSNTYTKVDDGDSGFTSGSLWYAKNITGGTTPTITVTLASGFQDIVIIAREFSGLDTTAPFDKHAETVESGFINSHPSGSTATTTSANQLVIGALAISSNESVSNITATGYSNITAQNGNDSFRAAAMADKRVTATGAQSVTFGTSVFSQGYVIVATFKEAAASTPVTVTPGVQSLTASQPAPTISAIRNVTITPAAQSLTASQPAPTISTVRNVTVTPGVQSLTFNQPAPTIVQGTGVTVTTGAVASTLVATNYVTNPSFENNLNGWNDFDSSGSATRTRSTDSSAVGTYALKIESAGLVDSGKLFQLTLPAGTYTVSAYVETGAGTDNACTVLRKLPEFENVLTSNLGENQARQRVSDTFTLTDTHTVEFVVGLGAYGATSDGVGWWDGFSITDTNSLIDYFDGATADTASHDYQWSGSAHDSTSRKYTQPRGIITVSALAPTVSTTTSSGVTVTPGVQSLTANAISPTISAVRNVTITPGVQSITANAISPTISAKRNVTITPGVQTITTTQVSPTVSAIRNLTTIQAVQTLQVLENNPTVSTTRNVTVTPGVQTITANAISPSVSAGDTVTIGASVLNATFNAISPTINAVRNVTTTPAVQTFTSSAQSPTIAASRNVSVSVGVNTISASQQNPTIRPVRNVTQSVGVQSCAFSQPSPTVVAKRNITTTPSVQSLTVTQLPITLSNQQVRVMAGVQLLQFFALSPTIKTNRWYSKTHAGFQENAVPAWYQRNAQSSSNDSSVNWQSKNNIEWSEE